MTDLEVITIIEVIFSVAGLLLIKAGNYACIGVLLAVFVLILRENWRQG